MNDHAKRAHSIVSPSACDRWWNCPASVGRILNGNYTESESPHAAEGTLAHELAEWALRGGTLLAFKRKNEVTPEMIDAVKVYVDTITDIMTAHDLKRSDMRIEKKLVFSNLMFGTCDCIFYDDFTETIYVVDFKYGVGVVVDVEENKQLMCYAAMALKEYPDAKNVELIIIQPRAYTESGPVKRWGLTASRLKEFSIELAQHIADTQHYQGVLACGDWCRWCIAKEDCPAYLEKITEGLGCDIEDFSCKPLEKTISPELVGRILSVQSLVKDRFKLLEEKAIEYIKSGVNVPGFKLVRPRAQRKWMNEEEVKIRFYEQYGDEIFDTKLKSPAKLEKLVGKGEVAELVTQESDGVTLASEYDKRPAVVIDVASDFKDIEL